MLSPERVRDYWSILTPQLEQLSVDADDLQALSPEDLYMMATSLRAIAKQLESLANRMPGVISIQGEHAGVISDLDGAA